MKVEMKQQIKDARKAQQAHIRELKTQLKGGQDQATAARLLRLIGKEENRLKFYKAAAQPVEFKNGLVVDSSYIKAYLRKTRAAVSAEIHTTVLVLKHEKGKTTFFNLSEHYHGLVLPSGEDFLAQCRL